MDDKEVALELLKLYIETHRERMDLDQMVETYLAILDALKGNIKLPEGGEEQKTEEKKDSDALFDFKEPLSLSDKEA